MKIFDVRKSYDKFTLFINRLEMPGGKIYGMIGPNGCGKTTAMKLMAGLISPDSGEIDHEGLTHRDITMIMRKPYLLHDTVLNNLVYPLKIRKLKPDPEKLEHYLEIAGLSDLRNENALGLSGGEQQKLALIRALIFSPKMILTDEAFSNMDIESVAFFEKYIINLQNSSETSITWVIISHRLSDIIHLCDHVYFLSNGEIKAEGKPDELLIDPENADLKRYLQYS